VHSRLTLVWFAILILYAWVFLWHEIKVYIWGFPCLDYPLDVLSLMGPWFKRIQSLSHIISFTLDFLSYDYAIPVFIPYLCSNPSFIALAIWLYSVYYLYVLTPWICTFRFPSLGCGGVVHRRSSFPASWQTSSSSSCRTFLLTREIYFLLVSILCISCLLFFWTCYDKRYM